jgi:hypothetical protein
VHPGGPICGLSGTPCPAFSQQPTLSTKNPDGDPVSFDRHLAPVQGCDASKSKYTPGLESGSPTKTTPPASSAALSAIRVLMFPLGTPSMTSMRLIVALPIPDLSAKSAELHLRSALAARI